MKRVKCFAFVMCAAIVLLFTPSCSRELTGEELDKVYDRLELVDEFYEQNVQSLSEDPIALQEEGTFRNVPFGSLRSDVEDLESLELYAQYDIALEYIETPVFGYNMTPKYWFNSMGQLFRGTYYFESSQSIDKIISSIAVRLSNIYGQPDSSDFYNYDNDVAVWSTKEELTDMISENLVYYYAGYVYGQVDIQFIIEVSQNSTADNIVYEVSIMFTDYSYNY